MSLLQTISDLFEALFNYWNEHNEINNEVENFKKLERRLNKKINSNICIINEFYPNNI